MSVSEVSRGGRRWEVITYKSGIEPDTFGAYALRHKKYAGIVKGGNISVPSGHAAGRFDVAMGKQAYGHFHSVFSILGLVNLGRFHGHGVAHDHLRAEFSVPL